MKPHTSYQNTQFSKTSYTKTVELSLYSLKIDDTITQKLIHMSIKLVNTLNSSVPVEFIDKFIEEMKMIKNLNILKSTLRLFNLKIKNYLNPVEDIKYRNRRTLLSDHLNILLNTYKNTTKFFRIFESISYLKSVKDRNLFKYLETLTVEEFESYLIKNKKFFEKNYGTSTTLYPYTGGKKKFYNEINSEVSNGEFHTYIDPFMGGLGCFYSSWDIIKTKGMKVILNDINHSLVDLNKHVKSKSLKVKKYISLIYRHYLNSNKTLKEYFYKLRTVLNFLEKRNDRSILKSSILLFLMNNSFSGKYEFKKNRHCLTSGRINSVFNLFNKIDLYSYLYRSVKTIFTNKDYKDVISKYSKEKTFTIIDSPYLEEKNEDTYSEINGTSLNYGDNGDFFDHEKLLQDLKYIRGNLLYFNYNHPLVHKYGQEYNLESTIKNTFMSFNSINKNEVILNGRILNL